VSLRATVQGIASHLPDGRVTNEQLAAEFGDWNVERILQKTGISERGLAGPDECASDLGIAAAEKLFNRGVCRPEDVDFLLFCTQSPDHFLPTTACLIQDRLGLRTECGALDYNLGCSGFVYGLALAKGLVESGIAGNVLLITAETYSKYIHPADRSVRTIFSDGAAATWISTADSDQDLIGPFVLGTDGRGAGRLIVESGAHRTRRLTGSQVPPPPNDAHLHMDGPGIFNFTIETVPPLVNSLLDKAGQTTEDIAWFVFHQANRFILEHLRRRLGVPRERFCINLKEYGNTVSSTIPMALELLLREGRIQTGDLAMIVGFGVGYSWAGTLVRFP